MARGGNPLTPRRRGIIWDVVKNPKARPRMATSNRKLRSRKPVINPIRRILPRNGEKSPITPRPPDPHHFETVNVIPNLLNTRMRGESFDASASQPSPNEFDFKTAPVLDHETLPSSPYTSDRHEDGFALLPPWPGDLPRPPGPPPAPPDKAFQDAMFAANLLTFEASAVPEIEPPIAVYGRYTPATPAELLAPLVETQVAFLDGDEIFTNYGVVFDPLSESSMIEIDLVKDLGVESVPWIPPAGGRSFMTFFGRLHSDLVTEVTVRAPKLGIRHITFNFSVVARGGVGLYPVRCLFGRRAIQKLVDGSEEFANKLGGLCGDRLKGIVNPWVKGTEAQRLSMTPELSSLEYLLGSLGGADDPSSQAPGGTRENQPAPTQPESKGSVLSPSTESRFTMYDWQTPHPAATLATSQVSWLSKPGEAWPFGGAPMPLSSSFHTVSNTAVELHKCTVDTDIRSLRPPGSIQRPKPPTIRNQRDPYSPHRPHPGTVTDSVGYVNTVPPTSEAYDDGNISYVASQGQPSITEADTYAPATGYPRVESNWVYPWNKNPVARDDREP